MRTNTHRESLYRCNCTKLWDYLSGQPSDQSPDINIFSDVCIEAKHHGTQTDRHVNKHLGIVDTSQQDRHRQINMQGVREQQDYAYTCQSLYLVK